MVERLPPYGCFLVGILLTAGAVLADEPGDVYELGDWKLAVRLIPEKRSVMVGEPIWLHYEVRNLGQKDLQIQTNLAVTAMGRSTEFQLQVVRADTGEPLALPDTGPVVGSLGHHEGLPAQKTYVKSLFLPYWAVLDRPGTHTVTCERTLILRRPGDGPRDESHAIATTTRLTLEVVPYDAEAMNKVIRTNADEILLGEDSTKRHQALRSLQTIHDERAVPWWLMILDTGDSHRMYEAASALGAYSTDLALDGLRRASRTQAKDIRSGNTEDPAAAAGAVRWASATALGRCGHPNAQDVLLAMRFDPRPSIRVQVVRALAEDPSRESTEVLKMLATDSDPKVRREAEDALGHR